LLSRRLSKAFIGLAALTSLATTVLLWGEIAVHQEMWPLPGFYLIEIIVLPAFAFYVALSDSWPGTLLCWAMLGASLGFVLLGAMSLGFFYLPVVLFLLFGVIMSRRARGSDVLKGIAIALSAVILQAGAMLILIRILSPGAVF
jgi:hypothetical protein